MATATKEPTEAEKAAAAAAAETEAKAAAAAAAEAAKTPEQKEGETAYQRAKFLHGSNYGPDPDKEIIRLPDGTDEHNRAKWKEWDFRKPAAEAPAADKVVPEETEEEKVAREAKEAADAAEEERKKKEAAVAKKKKAAAPEVPAAAPQPDPEEIANRTAEAVVNRLAPKPPAPAEEKYSVSDQRVLNVLQGMEEMEGYKGITEATKEFWKNEKAYRSKWEKDNPGEVFDRAASDHSAWYQKNNPEFRHDDFDNDFETVQQEQAAERVISKRLGEREAKLEEREKNYTTSLRMREEAPEIIALTQTGKTQFIKNVLPEVVKAVAGDEEFVLTLETTAKITEHASPVQIKVVDELADELGLQLQELERLTRYAGSYRPNQDWKVELHTTKKEFFPHRELLRFANWLEAAVASDKNNARDGRQFLPTSQYQERVGTIVNGAGTRSQKEAALADLDKRYYRLSSDDVREALVTEYTHRAGIRIKELSELVEATTKKNGTVKTSPATAQPGQGQAPTEPPVKPRAKPPASTSASDRVNTKPAKELSDSEREALMRSML